MSVECVLSITPLPGRLRGTGDDPQLGEVGHEGRGGDCGGHPRGLPRVGSTPRHVGTKHFLVAAL